MKTTIELLIAADYMNDAEPPAGLPQRRHKLFKWEWEITGGRGPRGEGAEWGREEAQRALIESLCEYIEEKDE